MRIAVIGAGALGGFYGGLLARAGEDVTFLVHGDTLGVLRRDGLRVTSAEEALTFALPVDATDDPAAVGVVDVLVHATKTNGFVSALEWALPVVGPDTLVVTLQNGVEAPELAASLVGRERVVPGVVRVFTDLEARGVVRHQGGPGTVTLGTHDGLPHPTLDAFAAALRRAGATVIEPDDIWVDLWLKAMYIVPFGAIGGLTGDPIGQIRASGGLRDAYAAAAGEIEAVGRIRGVPLPADAVQRTLAFTDGMPPDATASMQRDLLAGRPSELDAQVGGIVRMGDAVGIPTPLHDLLLRALTPQAT